MPVPKVPNPTAAAALAHLADGPASGWDVAHGLQTLVGGFWSITPSQIYRELKAMAANGLLEAGDPGARDRRVYTITDAGRDALAQWLDEEPGPDTVRIPILLKLHLGRSLPDERLARYVASYREHHEARLARLERVHAELEAAGAREAHIVRYGLYHEEAALRWLDSLPWR